MTFEVYRTENKLNGKFYYGVKDTSMQNNHRYLGSGHRLKDAIKKYGKENFVRRRVKAFETAKEAYGFEALIVDDDFVMRSDCYNAHRGGNGGFIAGYSRPSHSEWMKNNSPLKRKVENLNTGKIYNSLKEACEIEGWSYGTARNVISGKQKSLKFNIKYL